MEKMNIKINNKTYTVPTGQTVHQAAAYAGIDIPVMCENEDVEHFSSCMVCLVKDAASGKLFPSCSMHVQDGMDIITNDEEILEARKISLELLLSEHVGDCEAPCVISCPAHMDIPEMNRMLEKGNTSKALEIVKQDIALPAALGRICPAPCEAACRRKGIDGAVSICLLKRKSADEDLECDTPFKPDVHEDTGRNVAVVGGGPAGLAAAFYLRIRGHGVTIYEKEMILGGALRVAELRNILPGDIIDKEIDQILSIGIDVRVGFQIDENSFTSIVNDNDAVVIAIGAGTEPFDWGIRKGFKGFEVSKPGYQSSNPKIFAIGNAVRESKLAVRSVGQGKEVAFSVDQYFSGSNVTGEPRRFNSRFGKLTEREHIEFLKEASHDKRVEPSKGLNEGMTNDETVKEAARCMHCDCRDKDNCTLRELSELYQASQRSFTADSRLDTEKHIQHKTVIYEPTKCIKCGICVRLTRKHGEKFGLSFIGRGFDVRIGVPFNESLEAGLAKTALIVAEACPTGALSKK